MLMSSLKDKCTVLPLTSLTVYADERSSLMISFLIPIFRIQLSGWQSFHSITSWERALVSKPSGLLIFLYVFSVTVLISISSGIPNHTASIQVSVISAAVFQMKGDRRNVFLFVSSNGYLTSQEWTVDEWHILERFNYPRTACNRSSFMAFQFVVDGQFRLVFVFVLSVFPFMLVRLSMLTKIQQLEQTCFLFHLPPLCPLHLLSPLFSSLSSFNVHGTNYDQTSRALEKPQFLASTCMLLNTWTWIASYDKKLFFSRSFCRIILWAESVILE